VYVTDRASSCCTVDSIVYDEQYATVGDVQEYPTVGGYDAELINNPTKLVIERMQFFFPQNTAIVKTLVITSSECPNHNRNP